MQKIISNKKLNLLQSSFLPNVNDSNALWNRNADVTFSQYCCSGTAGAITLIKMMADRQICIYKTSTLTEVH